MPNTSHFEQRYTRYQAKDYMIVGDTLYHRGINTVLQRCLMHEEAEKVLNDCHSCVCRGHQSSYATTQKILRAGYLWPTIFKDCIIVVRSYHACEIFDHKTRLPPTLLHPVVVVGPFTKWGIDFMKCNPTSAGGHGYIIVAVNYFTKWAEAIVTDHGSHFHIHMMVELVAKLGRSHDCSTRQYRQANGQVEAINKVLKRMLQRMIGVHKRNWNLILYSALWAYNTLVRNTIGFTPFQLLYGLEAFLPIQCEISSLRPAVDLLLETLEEEARFLELIQLDENRCASSLVNEAHKKHVKAQFYKNVKPYVFLEGDLVLLYDQDSNKLGVGKFEPLWMGPYIVKKVLEKGAYELVDYDGIPLSQPWNELYLKH
eukprot:PITA_31133